MAHTKQLLDKPNLRNVHRYLTPRLGGVAIFAGFTSAITIFGQVAFGVQQLLAGSIILFFIGLRDDIIPVTPAKKFVIQVLATAIVVFLGDIHIKSLEGMFFLYELPSGISYLLTFLVIIGITNAFNLIDGIDGIAGTFTVFTGLVLTYYFFSLQSFQGLVYAMVSTALVGSVLGFLRYNFRNAIIFMGDTGSLLCGFILAIAALKLIQLESKPQTPLVLISIFYIPIFDTIRVFTIRLLSGRSPFKPDANHIHHILKNTGIPNTVVVLTLLLCNILIYTVTISIIEWNVHLVLGFFMATGILLAIFLQFLKKWSKASNG